MAVDPKGVWEYRYGPDKDKRNMYNRIVGMKGEKLVDYPVDEALEMTKTLDPVLIDVCNTISICFFHIKALELFSRVDWEDSSFFL